MDNKEDNLDIGKLSNLEIAMIQKLRSISEEQMIEFSENDTLNGVYETISELIGFHNTKILYENFRGQQICFPVRLFSKQ